MEDGAEQVLRRICCTCLSTDRKLNQLCKLDDGINNLFLLLSSDSEAYKALFSIDATHLYVCWECTAFMKRHQKFRDQVCLAQKKLSQIADGRIPLNSNNSFTKLSIVRQNSHNKEFKYADTSSTDNFIDCGLDIKIESDNNIHLLDVQFDSANESIEELHTEIIDDIKVLDSKIEIKPLSIKTRKLKRECNKGDTIKINKEIGIQGVVKEEGYSKIHMTDKEMIDYINVKKLEINFINAKIKCVSCIEVFKDDNQLEEHNARLHVQKPKFIQCDICRVYIKFWWLTEHRNEHYLKYQCHFCAEVYYSLIDMLTHLRGVHSMRNAFAADMLKKLKRKAMLTNPILAPKRNVGSSKSCNNGDSSLGFKCSDCNKYFENRYLRYKHILKLHREGHKCAVCGKTFAFKNTLNKHLQVHGDPQPQEQCPICGKMVRTDRVKFHARIHGERKSYECVACDKSFVSHDSYEKHLKYSRSHTVRDVHKYKCTMCDKGFRTIRELNDHTNYNHMGKTQYKCPICHKALATRRCVTRHVSRAHHGIKEKAGDKILCQTCGKAFRDKKCLREHELIHTGEKPLSCDMCGRTFRQSACLYTHKRRVHKVAPKRLHVQHTNPEDCLQVNKNEIN